MISRQAKEADELVTACDMHYYGMVGRSITNWCSSPGSEAACPTLSHAGIAPYVSAILKRRELWSKLPETAPVTSAARVEASKVNV